MRSTRFAIHLLVPLALLLCLVSAGASHAATVFFLDGKGTLTGIDDPAIADPVSALNALAAGPSAVYGAYGLGSAIPNGTRIDSFRVDGDEVTIGFSKEIFSGDFGEAALEAIFKQVKATLYQFSLDKNIELTFSGEPLSDYLKPTPVIEPGPSLTVDPTALTGALTGRSITLSPGHGLIWNGGQWITQRPVYCAPLSEEDYHNLEICQYLEKYLLNDGMTVKMARCTDKSYGNHATGNPWWKMGSYVWLQNLGYPCSVYASYTGDCTTGTGADESSDDIRARPLMSDYDVTDIYISVHTNGSAGDCTGACPTGSDTYYDCSKEHKNWCTVSTNLANAVHPELINTIRTQVPVADWVDRGIHDSAGAYGEIRIPDRAAILIELGFHDTCDRDAIYLRDNFFRSAVMWSIYKGVCNYFGTIPTWDFYSDQYVSDDIPTLMKTGQQYTCHVTFRNMGVLWNEAKAFRLGAVGDSDPFSAANRYAIAGEVGPGDTYTFTLNLTAPVTEGTYTTDWQMVRDGFAWFGAVLSRNVQVTAQGDIEPPSAPTNLVGTAQGPYQVDLSWTASTDNVGVTGYNVYRNGVNIGSSMTTSYSDTTAQHSTTYSYQVTALDAAQNESAMSNTAVVTTPEADLTPPTVPTNLVGTPINGLQVDLTWNPSTDNVGVTGYNVYRNSALIGWSATTSYSDVTTQPNTTYTYEVTAYDAAGNESAKSAPAIVTTPNDVVIIDNPACQLSGTWSTGTASVDKYGYNYYYATTARTETAWAIWRPNLSVAGQWGVYVWYPQGTNRSAKAPYTIYYSGGSHTYNVNQQDGGGMWNLLATYPFAAGTTGYVKLGNGTRETSKVVMADAVKFQYSGP